jgi:transcriptional regulator with XRE-family HTH domain
VGATIKTGEQMSEFARLLREKRKDTGLSQGELAKMLGYGTSQFISNWERDISLPPANTLTKLSEIFNIKLETLIVHWRAQCVVHEVGKIEKRLKRWCPQAYVGKATLATLSTGQKNG